jgi:phosphate transport system permease protein
MTVLRAPTAQLDGTPPTRLQGHRLPGYALPGLAAVAVLLTLGLFAITPMQGVADFLVVAALIYVVVQTAVSFRFEGRRQAKDRLFTTFVVVAFLLAATPLIVITWYTVKQGVGVISSKFLTTSMFRVDQDGPGGGVYHAIVGTLEQSLLATAIAAPLGILAAVYLVEYGMRGPFARTVSFFVDVMTGVPSIVAGLFVYSAWILVLGFRKSGFAGSLALFILMLPVVIRATEEMLKLVPNDLREAAYALGVPKWRTILRVVLPTAVGGIVTGVMLGVARIMGETAPLLLLVGINQKIQTNPFAGRGSPHAQESLPTFIFEQFQVAVGNTAAPAFRRAWGAALVLIVIIGLLNLLARLVARFARIRG